MHTPSVLRRFLWWSAGLAFLAVVTAGAWAPFVVRAAVEKDYHFLEVRIDAHVLPNGDLVLEERRTFAFKNGPFSFAYFEVDDPLARLRDLTISEVRVGGGETPVTPDYASHSMAAEAFQARWSFMAEDEERTWIFRYRMSCGIDVYSDTAHLFWQFIGTGWDEPTDRASVTVHLPGRSTGSFDRPGACDPDVRPFAPIGTATPLEGGDVRAWGHGPLNGEVRLVDPQTIVFDVRDVPPASFVEGSILFPTDAVPLAPLTGDRPRMVQILEEERALADEANALRRRHRAERAVVVALFVLVPLACALLALMAWLRDRVPGVPRILREPPEDDPVEAAFLWAEYRGRFAPLEAYRTQMLRMVTIGAVELRADGRVTDPRDLTIVKRKEPKDLDNPVDADFQALIFGTEADGDGVRQVSVKQPKPPRTGSTALNRYTKWLSAAKRRVAASILRIKKGDARIESWGVAFVALGSIGYGLWTAWFGLGGPIGYWLIPVGLTSMILSLRTIPPRLDPALRERIERLKSFRRFLRRFSLLPDAPAMAVIV
jgi:Predicted membrane protein (DUF2207)